LHKEQFIERVSMGNRRFEFACGVLHGHG
jgi:hypothetical protein